jgi:hypothetical protein
LRMCWKFFQCSWLKILWINSFWGREQCSKMANQISPRSHYYLKDLKHIYYGCFGLP